MDFSANKGEWSEIYALFKLLGEGEVFAGDANLNKLDVYYPIVDIIRRESLRRDYRPDRHARIVVMSEEGKEFLRVDMKQFLNEAEALLKQIKCATTPSFEVPSAERFMRCLRCEKVKMGSQDKADIQIVIHDLRTGMRPELGFSIKSQLGNPSTLINASKVTNVLFKLRGKELSDDEITRINAVKGQEDRMEAVKQAGCTVEYEDVEHETFKNNLLFLDCCMPQFVGECLLTEYVSGETNLQRVAEKVAERNPFCYSGGNCGVFYAHKMKVLLISYALGMMSATVWEGRYEANGGYIVVREDGEIVCYHFYDRNEIEDYLYCNTRFEHASRSRHNFGSVFRGEDGAAHIRLNLQVRFIK